MSAQYNAALALLESYDGSVIPADLASIMWSTHGPDSAVAQILLESPELPAAVHTAIGKVKAAEVRQRWFSHPQTTTEEAVAAFASEKRSTVCAAVAASRKLTPAVVSALMDLNHPKVNTALLYNTDLPKEVAARTRGTILACRPLAGPHTLLAGHRLAELVRNSPELAEPYLEMFDPTVRAHAPELVVTAADNVGSLTAWERACEILLDPELEALQSLFETLSDPATSVKDVQALVTRSPWGTAFLSKATYMLGTSFQAFPDPVRRRVEEVRRLVGELNDLDVVRKLGKSPTPALTPSKWVELSSLLEVAEKNQSRRSATDSSAEELIAQVHATLSSDVARQSAKYITSQVVPILTHKNCTTEVVVALAKAVADTGQRISLPGQLVDSFVKDDVDDIDRLAALLSCSGQSWPTTVKRWERLGVNGEAVVERALRLFGAPSPMMLSSVPLTVEAAKLVPASYLSCKDASGTTTREAVGLFRRVRPFVDQYPAAVWPVLLSLVETLPDDVLLGDAVEVAAALVADESDAS